MGFSALAGAGIRDAERLFRPAVAPSSLPGQRTILPGVYVLAEPAGAPRVGAICTNWRHASGAAATPCPWCGPGWA